MGHAEHRGESLGVAFSALRGAELLALPGQRPGSARASTSASSPARMALMSGAVAVMDATVPTAVAVVQLPVSEHLPEVLCDRTGR